jgi:predicted glycosyltransferase
MRFLIEINHPGQVHLLKNVIYKLSDSKYKYVVICKNEPIITELLRIYSIPFQSIGTKGNGKFGKLFKQFLFTFRAYKIAKKNKLTIGLGSSFTNDLLTVLIRNFKSIHLSDDDEEMVPFITKYSYPFATVILAPDCLNFPKYNYKVVSYKGYHELAYLHSENFQPDSNVLTELDVKENETFFVLRFVALKGHHDAGHMGITLNQKRILIEKLKKFGKIFITSETNIEPEFEKYRFHISPDKIHSVLFYSSIFIGDSQTMTSEACILGTPALKCNTFSGKLSIPNELEKKYELCFSFQPNNFDELLNKLDYFLINNCKYLWKNKRSQLLKDKINVSEFIFNFITSANNTKLK